MKKMIILVGDNESKSTVSEVLLSSQKNFKILEVYHVIQEALSETFKTPLSRSAPKDFTAEVTENHLRKFFGKMARGPNAISNYVGKKINNSNELIDYFMKIGAHAWGPEFLYKSATESFLDKPVGVYLVIDADMVEAKKMKSLLPSFVEIVQITKPDEEHEEGIPFFSFDPSEKSWKKSLNKMFEIFNENKKETTNGKQRNA